MYNKLFTKILDSTVWLENDATRLVWITFLAVMDEDGFVALSSVGNVAARARVSAEAAAAAVKSLESPDSSDASQEHEGRRIERVPYGWMVLNASKYRDIVQRSESMRKNRERVARHREGRNADVMACNGLVMQLEAVSETSKALSGKPDLDRSVKQGRAQQAVEIIAFLNNKAGRNYQPVKQNVDLVVGLLNGGVTADDIRSVVAKKVREWKGKPEMETYLRPATLFGPKNFHSKYHGELVAK